jgi:hypothetical protein
VALKFFMHRVPTLGLGPLVVPKQICPACVTAPGVSPGPSRARPRIGRRSWHFPTDSAKKREIGPGGLGSAQGAWRSET